MASSVHILDRCKDLIKHVQYLVSVENPNPPQINKQQCKLLAEKLPRLQGAILKFEVDTYLELLANKETEASEIASLIIPAVELNSVLERIDHDHIPDPETSTDLIQSCSHDRICQS